MIILIIVYYIINSNLIKYKYSFTYFILLILINFEKNYIYLKNIENINI